VHDTKTHWTYWDTAIMNVQVLEKLGVTRFFVLGTSQGGWITVRMALLAPERVSLTVLCAYACLFLLQGM
jgi:pimeloyl-ACP methyl ester carboxylesterase